MEGSNFEKPSDITLEGFITNLLKDSVSDDTIEAMFKDIYKADLNMAKEALEALEHSDREVLAKKMAEFVIDDQK